MSGISEIWTSFAEKYADEPKRVKLVDCMIVFSLLTAVVEFVYCSLVGTFPFNSFLSGFGCALGVFVLSASLRFQLSSTDPDFSNRSPYTAFAEYCMCNVILFLACLNFMG